MTGIRIGIERTRLENQRLGKENWRLWGPYLAERAWGTVREDYSPDGEAWDYLTHDQARSRAFRWSEDGLGGVSDDRQYLCFTLALWNGHDPILKERAFGLTGAQGNRGEDVKEYYFYVDATPTHSLLRYLYKYPHRAFPYAALVEENARRTRNEPPFNLIDTGVFGESRYFDVEVTYAKAAPDETHIRVVAANRGPEQAELHLLPTLCFRNTWAWGDGFDGGDKPAIRAVNAPGGAAWAVEATHPELDRYFLYGRRDAELLFTDNETNAKLLWGTPNAAPYVKDAFHRRVIDGSADAVNPSRVGSKFASWSALALAPGERAKLELVLSGRAMSSPFERSAMIFAERQAEADEFYRDLVPAASDEDRRIARQALAGMIWTKQFFH
jgi:hypothetical protein